MDMSELQSCWALCCHGTRELAPQLMVPGAPGFLLLEKAKGRNESFCHHFTVLEPGHSVGPASPE